MQQLKWAGLLPEDSYIRRSQEGVLKGFAVGSLTIWLWWQFSRNIYLGIPLLILIVLCGMWVCASIEVWFEMRCFGPSSAWVEETELSPGNTFQIRFEQPIRKRIEIEAVSLFLVFRERVRYDDLVEPRPTDIDRLVQQVTFPGRTYVPGEVVCHEHSFELPFEWMGITNSYMGEKNARVETSWVVKARIELPKLNHIWREYEIEADTRQELWNEFTEDLEEATEARRRHWNGPPRYFDLYTTWVPLKNQDEFTALLCELAPHLSFDQYFEFWNSEPRLIRQRLCRNEAEEAKSKLEAVGAKVKLKASLE